MNLKNNYLLRNLLKWAKKKVSILIFIKIKKHNKKNKEKHLEISLFCTCIPTIILRYKLWQTEIGKYGSLFALLPFPPKNPKNQSLKKWKKLLEISSFYTSVPKTTITWDTVPEIRSETDRIFCHFASFFDILPPSNQENQNF